MVRPRRGRERGMRAFLHAIVPGTTIERMSGLRPDRRGPSVRAIARRFEADLTASVLARGPRVPNVRQISERVAMGRALWRELVVGFSSPLRPLRRGLPPLAAPYVLGDGGPAANREAAPGPGGAPAPPRPAPPRRV